MKQEEKTTFLRNARKHLSGVQQNIIFKLKKIKEMLVADIKRVQKAKAGERMLKLRIIQYNRKREEELKNLHPSPYFVRCDVVFDNEKEKKPLYFAKFPFDEENIYSWAAPASVIRFEGPGKFSFGKPDGTVQSGKLIRKDQFMIVGGKIVFLATENLDSPRELIHQEHFSTRKTGFVLPEIVAQMEKAQDKVVRADYVGPFLISGPAGSGKTTLAFHRVAYLVQSPDTTKKFAPESIIVFVQDAGTKKYFSHLLPELGINNVQITTFAEWAMAVLGIQNIKYTIRYGDTEEEKELLEYKKFQALQDTNLPKYVKGQEIAMLEKIYESKFEKKELEIFQKQLKEKVLDRFDLTMLLRVYLQTNRQLKIIHEYYEELDNGAFEKVVKRIPLKYSLIIVDEFQNYMAEQLKVFKTCVEKDLQSLVYVGDMAQQTQMHTIKKWKEIDEEIKKERQVVLQKVYRNTKNILEYIKNLGYKIEVPKEE